MSVSTKIIEYTQQELVDLFYTIQSAYHIRGQEGRCFSIRNLFLNVTPSHNFRFLSSSEIYENIKSQIGVSINKSFYTTIKEILYEQPKENLPLYIGITISLDIIIAWRIGLGK